jgi:hypothetical protein
MVKYLLYLIRWQLSTPILAVVIWLVHLPTLWRTIVANLVGGLIFFWVDRFIFKSRTIEQWEVRLGRCHDCGKYGTLQRLVLAPGYDKLDDNFPEFRCERCSRAKALELAKRGIPVHPGRVAHRQPSGQT